MPDGPNEDRPTSHCVGLILELIKNEGVEHVLLKTDDFTFELSRTGDLLSPKASVSSQPAATRTCDPEGETDASRSAGTVSAPSREMPAPRAAAPPTEDASAAAKEAWPETPDGMIAVTAPSLGVYYSKPSPGANPFVKIGQDVSSDDTVALVEVMKLFSSVTAGTAGKIREILCEEGQMVEFGQPLLFVEPKAGQT